jgi:hypothetical protein
MKSILILFAPALMLLILTACGQQSAAMMSSVGVDITLQVGTEPLSVGETTLLIALTDSSGSRVVGAKLQVHGDMDHAGMTAVNREVNESTNGIYRVPFEWTMGGGWIVIVTAQLPDGSEISKTFEFFVGAVSSESIINLGNSTENTAVNIGYRSDNDPAIGGDAIVTITLTGKDDRPITDAVVEITGDMAHHGMMPISGKGEHTENGQYVVPLRWTMAGDWIVTVNIVLVDGSQFEQIFNQQVITP